MKITLFSDVHGNLIALEELLKREADSDQYIFLGDAVNYGPWSNECVDRIADLQNTIRIRGNHEEYFLTGSYPGANAIAQGFFKFCYPQFNRQEKIRPYLEKYKYAGFTCIHTIQDRNIYPDTAIELDGNYFIGHSHHQFRTVSNGHQLFNAGSIGQNRKYIDYANYLNWYPEEQRVDTLGFTYDIAAVIDEMKAKGYPEECLNYYLSKQRIGPGQ